MPVPRVPSINPFGDTMSPGVPVFAEIGNTNLRIAAWRGEWRNHARLAMPDATDSGAWSAVLDDVCPGQPVGVLVTVTSRATSACADALESAARERGAAVTRLGRELRLDMPCTYDDPGQLGLDRRLAAWAGAALAGAPCIVLDAGTYITCDAVTAAGLHLPIAIAPGLPIVLHGAGETARHLTALLREAGDCSTVEPGIGTRSSGDGLAAGLTAFLWGTAQALVGMGEIALGTREAQVVITGGDASRLVVGLERETRLMPTLCLDGLRLLYDASRHD